MAQGLAQAGVMVRGWRCAEAAAVHSAVPAKQPQLRRCGNGSGTRNSALALIARGATARRRALLLLQSGHGSQSPTTARRARASAGRHASSARAKQHGGVRFHRARASSVKGHNSAAACFCMALRQCQQPEYSSTGACVCLRRPPRQPERSSAVVRASTERRSSQGTAGTQRSTAKFTAQHCTV
jgi:hypothetical protein